MFKQKQSTCQSIGPTGFTLIELLVVISIMSMLMSILLPGLSRARESGKRVVCLSNLRQLTLAWNFYATDNDDMLCSPDTFWNDMPMPWPYSKVGDRKNHWVADGPHRFILPQELNPAGGTETAIKNGVLWVYTKTLELYRCKSDISGLVRSYSLSKTIGPDRTDFGFVALSQISRASEKMVFVDAGTRRHWLGGGFCPIFDLYAEVPWWWQNGINHANITTRHGGGCNMSFADGHCEHWKWKDPQTFDWANREMYLTDWLKTPAHDNPDIRRLVQVLKP